MTLLQKWRWAYWNWWKRVGSTRVGDEYVSTVCIMVPGMEGLIEEPYETMVFGDYDNGLQVRYKTRAEAKKGHWEIVNRLRQDQCGHLGGLYE